MEHGLVAHVPVNILKLNYAGLTFIYCAINRRVKKKRICLFYTTSLFCSPAGKFSTDIAIGDLSMSHSYSVFSSLSSALALI